MEDAAYKVNDDFYVRGGGGRKPATPARNSTLLECGGSRPVEQASGRGVPKILHQSWSGCQLKANHAGWRETCARMHPDWQLVLWTDADNRELVRTRAPWLLKTYDAYDKPIKRADAVRLLYLHTFGGVYLDLDHACLRPLSALGLNNTSAAMVGADDADAHLDRAHVNLANAAMAAPPRHPFFWHALRALPRAAARDTLHATGPLFLTKQAAHYRNVTRRSNASRGFHPFVPLARSRIAGNVWHGNHAARRCNGSDMGACRKAFPHAVTVHFWTHDQTWTNHGAVPFTHVSARGVATCAELSLSAKQLAREPAAWKPCCPAACARCGGAGCENRVGGRGSCCAKDIVRANRSCDEHAPPCVLRPRMLQRQTHGDFRVPPTGTGADRLQRHLASLAATASLGASQNCSGAGTPGIRGGHGIPVCCPLACGECGGRGCENRPGGRAACCAFGIQEGGRVCSKDAPPCEPLQSDASCDWRTVRTTGVRFQMCLRPYNDLVSSAVRNHGAWRDCGPLWSLWSANRFDVFLDVGANIGACTLLMASHGVPVYAFEPNPDNQFYLNESVARLPEAVRSGVHVFPFALGRRPAHLPIYVARGNAGYNARFHTHSLPALL